MCSEGEMTQKRTQYYYLTCHLCHWTTRGWCKEVGVWAWPACGQTLHHGQCICQQIPPPKPQDARWCTWPRRQRWSQDPVRLKQSLNQLSSEINNNDTSTSAPYNTQLQVYYAHISKPDAVIWTQCVKVMHSFTKKFFIFYKHEGQDVPEIIWKSWPM